jgi:hypothetical protein
MKLDQDARFPHPVLSQDTADYPAGIFRTDFSVSEKPDSAEVRLDYTIDLQEPSLQKLIADDQASLGIFVTCRDTYYSKLVPLGLAGGQVNFEPGALMGRVTVQPMIWTRKQVEDFSLDHCHEEFGGGTTGFLAGDILALDDEFAINVGREKLAQMETIFSIALMDSLPSGTFALNLDAERITVLVASDIYDTVNSLRKLPHGCPITLNSVFLPAVMQVLDTLREGAGTFEGRRWYKVFEAKCTHLGIDPANCDLWESAQKLLQSPFSEIHRHKELLGN